jgi:uncharacterized protein (TIGR02246 family)
MLSAEQCPAHGSGRRDLNGRDALNDIAQITALPSLIQKAVDEVDLEAFADTIATDCTFVIRRSGEDAVIKGKTAILEMTRRLSAGKTAGGLIHLVGSVIVELRDDQTAFVQSTCLYISPPQGFAIMGPRTYADELVKEDGRWRFSH